VETSELTRHTKTDDVSASRPSRTRSYPTA
jgi:hypothetical protein